MKTININKVIREIEKRQYDHYFDGDYDQALDVAIQIIKSNIKERKDENNSNK